MSALLSESNSVTALAYDRYSALLAVAQTTTVDILRGVEVVKTISPGIGTLQGVAALHHRVTSWSATGIVLQTLATNETAKFGGSGVTDAVMFSTNFDSNPGWSGSDIAKATSWYNESVPPGVFLGAYADATAAVAGGGVVGDWYEKTGTFTYFRLDDLVGGETQITRAGKPGFPEFGLIVATATEVVIFDIINGQPVMWQAQAIAGASSLAYADGQLYVGTSAGMTQYDYPGDTTTTFTTISTPAIVNDTVNAVSSKVLSATTATNRILWSEDFENPAWLTSTGATLGEISEGPDGRPAQELICGNNVVSRLRQNLTFTVGAQYTTTISVKQGTATRFALGNNHGASGDFGRAIFEWTAGGLVQSGTQGAVPVTAFALPEAGGFWRISITMTATDTGGNGESIQIIPDVDGGTGSIIISGAVNEPSSRPHSYIKTEASEVTASVPPAKQLFTVDIGGGDLETVDIGLFEPTFGIATDGGNSIGVDNGDIWDITGQAAQAPIVAFSKDDKFVGGGNFSSTVQVYDIPTADTTVSTFARRYFRQDQLSDIGAPKILGTVASQAIEANGLIAVAQSSGLTLISEDTASYFDGIYTWITTTYATQWMKGMQAGDGGAWLCDDDATTAVGGTLPDYSLAAQPITVVGTSPAVEFICNPIGSFSEDFNEDFD